MSDDKAFGERVSKAMARRSISDEELADRMDVSTHAVRSWRYGVRTPREMRKLAAVLRVSVGALYGERAA